MTKTRYHSVAIILHWVMAIGFIGMFAFGLFMVNADISKSLQFKMYQWHKASGVIMLVAIILRVLVRMLTKQPELPGEVPNQSIVKLGHIALYSGLIFIPLMGWLMVSASPFGLKTFVFVDWLVWPHVPYVERNKEVESLAKLAHQIGAYAMMSIVVGHIAAVIIHKQQHGVSLVKRMWWSRS